MNGYVASGKTQALLRLPSTMTDWPDWRSRLRPRRTLEALRALERPGQILHPSLGFRPSFGLKLPTHLRGQVFPDFLPGAGQLSSPSIMVLGVHEPLARRARKGRVTANPQPRWRVDFEPFGIFGIGERDQVSACSAVSAYSFSAAGRALSSKTNS